MISRHIMDVFIHQMQPDCVRVEIGADCPGLLVAIVARRSRQNRRAQRLYRDLANGPRLEHLKRHTERTLVRDIGPSNPRMPSKATTLSIRYILDLSGVDSPFTLAQSQAVSHPASMIETGQSHQVDAHATVLTATTVCVLAMRIDDQIPVETAEREIVGLQLTRLRLTGREHRRWHPDLRHVDRPHIRHG